MSSDTGSKGGHGRPIGSSDSAGGGPAAQLGPQDESLSVVHLLSVVLGHRYRVVGSAVSVALLVVLVTLVGPRSYTAFGTFIPQGVERPGQAQRLAGQLGLDLGIPGAHAGESPEFYADLLRSREILSPILQDSLSVNRRTWRGDTVQATGTLLDLVTRDSYTPPARRREDGLRWLQEEVISARTRPETGVVEISVTTPWPAVSAHVGHRLLDLVNEFNLVRRQTQARAERSFLEERIEEAEARLRRAEDGLKRFLEQNRAFENSPHLVFEHDRLQRQVSMHQQLYTQFSQNLETARISEVRNTPVITIVETPEEPVEPDPRGLAFRGILGLMLGGMLGVLWALGRDFVVRSQGSSETEFHHLQEVWEDTVSDLRRAVRLRARSSGETRR